MIVICLIISLIGSLSLCISLKISTLRATRNRRQIPCMRKHTQQIKLTLKWLQLILRMLDVCAKFHGNWSDSIWDISLDVNLIVDLEEKGFPRSPSGFVDWVLSMSVEHFCLSTSGRVCDISHFIPQDEWKRWPSRGTRCKVSGSPKSSGGPRDPREKGHGIFQGLLQDSLTGYHQDHFCANTSSRHLTS